MFGEIFVFGDNETKENNFHCYAAHLNLDYLYNIDKIIVKVSEKIIAFYSEDHRDYVASLYITFPQMLHM